MHTVWGNSFLYRDVSLLSNLCNKSLPDRPNHLFWLQFWSWTPAAACLDATIPEEAGSAHLGGGVYPDGSAEQDVVTQLLQQRGSVRQTVQVLSKGQEVLQHRPGYVDPRWLVDKDAGISFNQPIRLSISRSIKSIHSFIQIRIQIMLLHVSWICRESLCFKYFHWSIPVPTSYDLLWLFMWHLLFRCMD